jgi:hypothetical protein
VIFNKLIFFRFGQGSLFSAAEAQVKAIKEKEEAEKMKSKKITVRSMKSSKGPERDSKSSSKGGVGRSSGAPSKTNGSNYPARGRSRKVLRGLERLSSYTIPDSDEEERRRKADAIIGEAWASISELSESYRYDFLL